MVHGLTANTLNSLMKGIFEYDVDGVKRGFKFGTYGISIACEKEDCTVDVLYKRCGIPYLEKDSDGNPVVKYDQPKLKALLHLMYGAAAHYAEDNNLPVNFKVSNVSDWLDILGEEKIKPMLDHGLSQYVPKNSTSPAETGEKATA